MLQTAEPKDTQIVQRQAICQERYLDHPDGMNY